MNKFCRVCWNTHGWREPTREAQDLESAGSYVHDNGFGHEEWLFNFAWSLEINGTSYKYGFLQPINKYRDTYVGRTMEVALYTVNPQKDRLLVARIRELTVPDDKEIAWAAKQFKHQHWFDQMRDDLLQCGLDVRDLGKGDPWNYLNVRYTHANVHLLDPFRLIGRDHVVYSVNRYQPLDWAPRSDIPTVDLPPPAPHDPRRSEHDRTRSAMEGKTYSPHHVRLQNALYDHLVAAHGKWRVDYEKNYVDLTVRDEQETVFFEIKISPSARRCIREAIGQLLDYGHYPAASHARRFVVVGEESPGVNDAAYLAHLRKRYQLPIYYQQWDWANKKLSDRI